MPWEPRWSLKNGRDVLSFTYELTSSCPLLFYIHVFPIARGFTFCSLKCLLLILYTLLQNLSGCPFKSVILLTLSPCQTSWESPGYSKTHSLSKVSIGQVSTFVQLLRCQQTWPTLQATWEVPKSSWVVPYLKRAFFPIEGDLMRLGSADLPCTPQSKLCSPGKRSWSL